ncbi:MAG: hypothetical protein AB9846_09525 [Tenuifilaceae bacterium]
MIWNIESDQKGVVKLYDSIGWKQYKIAAAEKKFEVCNRKVKIITHFINPENKFILGADTQWDKL